MKVLNIVGYKSRLTETVTAQMFSLCLQPLEAQISSKLCATIPLELYLKGIKVSPHYLGKLLNAG